MSDHSTHTYRELLATVTAAAIVAYLTDPEIRDGVNAFIATTTYRIRLLRWWHMLAPWQREVHNQANGRDLFLQPENLKSPGWYDAYGIGQLGDDGESA